MGTDILGQILKIPRGAAPRVSWDSAAEKGLKGIQGVELLTRASCQSKGDIS